jgi:hypothetical protein
MLKPNITKMIHSKRAPILGLFFVANRVYFCSIVNLMLNNPSKAINRRMRRLHRPRFVKGQYQMFNQKQFLGEEINA